MKILIDIIIFILILSVIVIVHEFGHLITAKKFGVYCKEFSIGMGPLIWQKKGKETAWSIRAIPLGGYVSMVGEDVDNEDDQKLDIPFERTLPGIKKWKQIIVMAAGAMMNILLAWILFIGVTAYQGAVVVPAPALIDKVEEKSVADQAGFKAGDEIVYIETAKSKQKITKKSEVIEFMQFYPGETTFTVNRDGKNIKLTCTPEKMDDTYILGVYYTAGELQPVSLIESIGYGSQRMVDSVQTIISSLGKLISGVGLNQLSGPVGIYQVTAEITQDGFISTLALIALLSVNVGIFNLLPIPILDGGRIFILLIEAIIGRKLSEKVETGVMLVGLLMIVGLMLFATWNDISKLIF